MSATITGAIHIRNKLNNLGNTIQKSPKRIVKIASEARNEMVKRDLKGQKPSGGSFPALSPEYKKWKTEVTGRSIRDLNVESNMHNAEQVKAVDGGADIYFNNETERKKAHAHHFGKGKLPATHFFKLGTKQRKYIKDEINKPIKKAIGA